MIEIESTWRGAMKSRFDTDLLIPIKNRKDDMWPKVGAIQICEIIVKS